MRKTFYSLKPRRAARFAVRLTVYLAFVAVCLIPIFNFQIYPFASLTARAAATNRISEIINTAMSERLAADGGYASYIHMHYDESGDIAALETDTARLNMLRSGLLLDITERLRDRTSADIAIPLGNLVGGELASGLGPDVKIKLILADGVVGTLSNDFIERGINQTLHRIQISFDVTVSVLLPSKPLTFTLSNTYTVAETILVGDVPEAYTRILRGLDDIDEATIDDIYDFSAGVE